MKTNDTIFARKCSVTGQGMNEGWIVGDGDAYYKYEADAIEACLKAGYASIEDAYMNGDEEGNEGENAWCYWTTWEEIEDDENYFDAVGNEFNPDGTLFVNK